jgi:thioredoxin-like negative regulator of GroEL
VIEQILQADRLMQVDQVDKARDMYQRVVELDPGNAIAVVGLAQCALADGDDHSAHELAARALTIDPENDMARRMEARLSEIMRVRGESVERPAAAATPGAAEMRPIVTESVTTAPTPKTSPTPPIAPAPNTRPVMQKSLFDRLLGR